MGVYTAAKCDVCGAVKGPSNNWWLASVEDDGPERPCVFQLEPFDLDNYNACDEDLIVCGATCATKALSAYMERTLRAGQPENRPNMVGVGAESEGGHDS